MKKSRVFLGITIGLAVWFALDPRLRSKVYQAGLKMAEKGLIFARRSIDDFGERLLLAVQMGLKEAREKESELKKKIELSSASLGKK